MNSRVSTSVLAGGTDESLLSTRHFGDTNRGSEDINAEQDEPPVLKRQVFVLGSALILLISDCFHPVDSLTI